jgi:hypothetical protein
MPTPSIKETISAHDEGEDLPRMGGSAVDSAPKAGHPAVFTALIDIAREVEALKRECSLDPESPIAVQNSRYMGISYKLRALAAALSAAPQSDGWISVDERLPAHEQEVICTGFEGNNPAKKRWQEFAVFHDSGTFHYREEGDELYPPTHWRELFALPTTQSQGQNHE